MNTLNFLKGNKKEHQETAKHLSNMSPKAKNLYISFMDQHNIPIKLTDDNTYVLNFKESGTDDYLIKGSHEKIKIMAALVEGFRYNYFLLNFHRHICQYFKYINITATVSSTLITVNLFQNYSSLNDIEFFEFDYSIRTSQESGFEKFKMSAKFYVNDMMPSYYIDRDEKICLSVYYTDLPAILPDFIYTYKSNFEELLQQPIKQVDESILNLIKMIFI